MPGTCATFFTTNECPGVTWITLFGIIIDHAQKEKTKGAWIYFFSLIKCDCLIFKSLIQFEFIFVYDIIK